MSVARKHVRDVVVAEQKNILRLIHPLPQPVGHQPRLPEMILKVIEEISQKNGMVEFLRLQPVFGALKLKMDVRNYQGPHSGKLAE